MAHSEKLFDRIVFGNVKFLTQKAKLANLYKKRDSWRVDIFGKEGSKFIIDVITLRNL